MIDNYIKMNPIAYRNVGNGIFSLRNEFISGKRIMV